MQGRKGAKWTNIADRQKVIFKLLILKRNFATNPGFPESYGRFERLNEVTWKLTNGEMTNVPACHGFWGGYRTPKAIAWVIQVEGKWLARCKDQTSNPMSLNEAKAAAMAMAKGACGDYAVTNPIAHLNGIAARLLDAHEAARQRTALVCGKNRYAEPDHPRCSEPKGGCVSNEFKKVSFQQSGPARTSVLADLCAPSLLAEETNPLASCADLTR